MHVQVQGGLAPGERGVGEPGGRSRGRFRPGHVQGGLAVGEGAMEESGGWSRGRCRLEQVDCG